MECLEKALEAEGIPEIFNTDQGSQFTGEAFTGVLKAHEIKISMDGKGRALDNVNRASLGTVKYDDIYIRSYERMSELYQGLSEFFRKYNTRKHQTLGMSRKKSIAVGLKWRTPHQSNTAASAPLALPLSGTPSGTASTTRRQRIKHNTLWTSIQSTAELHLNNYLSKAHQIKNLYTKNFDRLNNNNKLLPISCN